MPQTKIVKYFNVDLSEHYFATPLCEYHTKNDVMQPNRQN